ncbi:MAG: hypothetical protein KAR19_18280 [Bacteroidales bacterium]|nr:hypothetical protein [Bacteroidales bacterium]
MKKAILIICAVSMAGTLLGANEKYYQKMGETLGQFNSCTTIDDFQALANTFRNIANMETEEWLPLYYEAQCYILMSFMDNSGAQAKDSYLDQANASLEKTLEMAPGESEVYALQALYYTGRLVVNPPARSMDTAPLVSAAIGKSLSLDPMNPRAKYIRLSNDIGTASYFGSDTGPYCQSARELLERWDSYPVKSPIHPVWGKKRVVEIVEACGK